MASVCYKISELNDCFSLETVSERMKDRKREDEGEKERGRRRERERMKESKREDEGERERG